MPHPRDHKVGLPPGSVVFVGEQRTETVDYHAVNFSPEQIDEETTRDLDRIVAYRDAPETTWINVTGVHDTDPIREIGEVFGLHPLTQEDIANTKQRPKLEVFDEHIYIVTKMLRIGEDGLRAEQVSLVVGPDFLISFQEAHEDLFDPVRSRLRAARGRIRTRGPDYLAYSLLDVIVDHYFLIFEHLDTRAEALEDEVLDDPTEDTQSALHELRQDLVFARRMIWPIREVLSRLSRLESDLWTESTEPFVRDAYDHAVQVIDLIESLREVVAGLRDLYMTSLSNRMNEIMKVLTIMGTIFIPLTFVAGIYGMNFEYMPELNFWWAYPASLFVMALIAGILLLFFRRREWI